LEPGKNISCKKSDQPIKIDHPREAAEKLKDQNKL
jgi:hypothetical protein